ncbi:MAG: hypothetical protein A2015_07410 [Spirochaetes bacterium GWF1_31_7]|nr:MAG: hypothetical protein A2Y30_02785 [Spirochaetes bacterium GWE1_32_154]OHD47584.1 MAG: hypothetical protein A2Y29_00230 [Spirochaetes bacterium GWE2_31_10]OHD51245.1 MAG: hypothetical protein A2015_07410 [Spirochaetes bacterium GWF1_31_7]HBD96141.1 orotate phosphoribosyltransferase [Spirochaetia bacterium]HBI37399.1 orotate phosphoribosyltransferase [Spirochaetia bacterium]
MNIIAKKLFETEAIKVANPESPFWYTSGKIGPYFINTHFLYGSKNDADQLLSLIDSLVSTPEKLIKEITEEVTGFYNSNALYQDVMEEFVESIKKSSLFNDATIITGGERRDWFFSILVAKLTGKRHVFIFKDLKLYDEDGEIKNLNNEKVSHIADLITEASSYERAWIPAIKNANGKLIHTASIVDRCQGGYEFLTGQGIECYSSVKIEREFFDTALNEGILSQNQYKMIVDFTIDPNKYGSDFITANPEFMKKSLESSDKGTKSKAQRCIDENTYGIDVNKLQNK